jgi:hypothetical protein
MTTHRFLYPRQRQIEILSAAQIPGDALETALAFKSLANDLAAGRLVLAEPQKDAAS